MSKHTPGPWKVYDDSDDGKTNRIEIVAIGKTVARIYHSVPAEDLPNARLIASAPDLLLALKNLELGVSLFEARYLHDPKNITVAWEQLDQYKQAARELLAKFKEEQA